MPYEVRDRRRRGIGVGAMGKSVYTVYVNTATGSDSNDGLTPSASKLTLASALTAITNNAGGIGRILVTASASAPVQGFVSIAAGEVTIEGLNGVDWYMERSTTLNDSSWVSDGGGVYHHTSTSSATNWFVRSILTGNGFETRLTQNSSTPTTPAAGEFGYSGSTLYVRLPGDVNPNTGNGGSPHIFKRANTAYLLQLTGTAKVSVRGGIGLYGGTIYQNTSPAALLYLYNCQARYAHGTGSGIQIPMSGGYIYCHGCTSQANANDGFNAQASSMTLVNCDGSYNDDEGASNHNGSGMNIQGGRYHHNFSGGCTAVNSGSQMYLNAVTVDYNGAKAGGGVESNGINFDVGTSGSVVDCTAQNNTGSGYYCAASAGAVTVTNLTSGTDEGNTLDDVLC
jgi:hypothetical protein